MSKQQWKTINVSSGYGGNTRQPFVQIEMDYPKDHPLQDPNEARDLAQNLLQAAEAAEQDAFIFEFVSQELKGGENAGASTLMMFRKWRNEHGQNKNLLRTLLTWLARLWRRLNGSHFCFLCTTCQAAMCADCRQIAEEYQELYERQKHELGGLLHTVGELQIKLANCERRAKLYEETAKAGIPQVVAAWLDQEIGQLVGRDDHERP